MLTRLKFNTQFNLPTLIFLFGSFITSAQNSTYTSNQSGTWGTAAIWTCVGTCSTTTPTSITDHAVVVNHIVTSSTAVTRQAYSITISNTVNSQDAKLNLSGSSNVIVGAGGLSMNGTNDSGGDIEFSITGTGTATIGGSANMTRNQNSSKYLKFRVGGGASASSATATINGNLTFDYLNSSNASGESDLELSTGNAAGDTGGLTINGNATLNYNFGNNLASNPFTWTIANGSSVNLNGNLAMTITEGGTTGKMRLFVLNSAQLLISGNASLNFNDASSPNSGSNLSIEVGDISTSSTGLISVGGNLSFSSPAGTYTSSGNNYVKAFDAATFRIIGNVNFSSSGGGPSPAIDNRIELNGSGNLEMRGNVSNPTQGSFEYKNSGTKVIFSGASAQVIPINLRTTSTNAQINYQNIEIKNAAGVSLNANLTADGTVTLTTGILTSTSAKLLTLSDAGTTAGGSYSSFITGPVKKICPTGNCGNTILHIGDTDGTTNVWAPLDINTITSEDLSTVFNVQYHKTAYSTTTPDVTFNNVSVKEYWDIAVTGTVPSADMTFYWKDACYSQIKDVTTGGSQDLFFGHYNSGASKWNKLPAGNTTIGVGSQACNPDAAKETGSITVTGINSFSASPNPFTFISQTGSNPLPIELESFDARLNESDIVNLQWTTASETNTDYFILERSANGLQFEQLLKIAARGFTTQAEHYYTADENPFTGKNYYRLKQVDLDGKVAIYKIVMVQVDHVLPKKIISYPNPAEEDSFLYVKSNFTIPAGAQCYIFNNLGKPLFSFKNPSDSNNIEVESERLGLTADIYFFQIIIGKERHTCKLIVK